MRPGAAVLSLALGLLAWADAGAQEDGRRYEAVVIPQGARFGEGGSLQPKVLILDVREGHFWTFEENVRLPDQGPGAAFGSALIYQGRVRPGTRAGELVERSPSR